jgi:hypothetical protein
MNSRPCCKVRRLFVMLFGLVVIALYVAAMMAMA